MTLWRGALDHRGSRSKLPGAAVGAVGAVVVLTTGLVLLLTHVVAPRLLAHDEHFPALTGAPKWTTTAKGIAADPVNVALIGTAAEVARAFRDAGWARAESLSRASDVAIAKSVLFNRPDSTAPVSLLYLFGRRQDLAYEQQVGTSARRRHHVRLWLDAGLTYRGRPVWIGGATYDVRVGVSHRGLHPTHHIAPDVDEERDGLVTALARAGRVERTFRVTGIGVRIDAHNAEGDRYDTDGELRVAVIAADTLRHPPPADPGVPPLVALKDRLWQWGHRRHRVAF